MFYPTARPDDMALFNGQKLTPLATLHDEYGNSCHVVFHGGGYMVLEGKDDALRAQTIWRPEAVQIVKGMPDLPTY